MISHVSAKRAGQVLFCYVIVVALGLTMNAVAFNVTSHSDLAGGLPTGATVDMEENSLLLDASAGRSLLQAPTQLWGYDLVAVKKFGPYCCNGLIWNSTNQYNFCGLGGQLFQNFLMSMFWQVRTHPGTGDLYAINRQPRSGGNTEVLIWSKGADDKYLFGRLSTIVTALPPTDLNWDFELSKTGQLFAINRAGDANCARTQLLILDPTLQIITNRICTVLHQTHIPAQHGLWDFSLQSDNGNLYGFKKTLTGTSRTEVHVLGAIHSYSRFILQTGIFFNMTSTDHQFMISPQDEIYVVTRSTARFEMMPPNRRPPTVNSWDKRVGIGEPMPYVLDLKFDETYDFMLRRGLGPLGSCFVDIALVRENVRLWTNQARRDNGNLPALTANAALNTACQRHAEDMSRNGYSGHTGSDWSTPWTRATAAGYVYGDGSNIAENVAFNIPNEKAVVDGWMLSPGHRANILTARYTNIGVGLACKNKVTYWCQIFGKPPP